MRHYNDIDNISPAIYFYLEKNTNHRADVILYEEHYDYRDNLNLEFLKKTYGDRFAYRWIGEYFGIDPDAYFAIHSIEDALIFKFFSRRFDKHNWIKTVYFKIREIILVFYTAIKKLLRGDSYSRNGGSEKFPSILDIRRGNPNHIANINEKIKLILEENGWPSLVIFDLNRTWEIQGLLNGLRHNGFDRIIALPVSPLINFNVLRAEKHLNIYSEKFALEHDYSGFDAIGFVDNYYFDSYNRLMKLVGLESSLEGKTTNLGSIRYTPKWIEIREKIYPPFEFETKGIKVAFFPSHPRSNVNWDEVECIFTLLDLFPAYKVIVKYHTRHTLKVKNYPYTNLTFLPKVDSSKLIDWADVVLFWSSSVAIEGYLKQKTMVCLDYVVGNKSQYNNYGAGFIVNCRDDLVEFLIKYPRDLESLVYNQDGITQLLQNIIPGGDAVIKNYLTFMEDCQTPDKNSKKN